MRHMFKYTYLVVAVVVLVTGAHGAHAADSTRVEEIDRRVEAMNTFFVAGIEQGRSPDLLQSLIVQRKKALLELAAHDPRLFLERSLPQRVVERIPETLRQHVEQRTTISGTLEVVQQDDFSTFEHAHIQYVVRAGSDRVNVIPVGEMNARSGATWRVQGIRLDNTMVAYPADITTTGAPSLDSVGEQKTLILLLEFANAQPHTLSAPQISDRVFNGPVAQFYREQSYGKVRFTGVAHGWFRLNRPDSCEAFSVSYVTTPEFEQLVRENNISLGQYDRVVLAVNGPCVLTGSGTIGKTAVNVGGKEYSFSVAVVGAQPSYFTIPWGQQPFEWTFWDYTLAHELGHNLGVYHANGWDCGNSTLYGSCQHREYLNLFDVMGRGTYTLHFNALAKETLGWFSPQEVLTITSPGRYTIGSLNAQGATQTLLSSTNSSGRPITTSQLTLAATSPRGSHQKKIAKIKLGNGTTPFYIEHRRAQGFDRNLQNPLLASNQEGLFVNWMSREGAGDPVLRLLDIVPTGAEWILDMYDATLNVASGKTARLFTDDQRGVTIGPVVSRDATSITFEVAFNEPVCNRAAPQIGFFENTHPRLPAGSAAGSLLVRFTNADSIGCGESEFEVRTDIPATWNPVVQPSAPLALPPASEHNTTEGVGSISFTVPADTPPESDHTLTVWVRNLASGLETVRTATLRVSNAPHITDLSPEQGPADTLVTLSGTGMGDSPLVLMSGPTASAWIVPLKVSDTSLTIQIPATMTGYACGCSLPTPLGEYGILVFAQGFISEQLSFEVVGQSEAQAGTPSDTTGKTLSNILGNALSAYVKGFGKLVGF